MILKRVNEVPVLASCMKCQLRFFTPNTYYNDHIEAAEYLREKFDEHTCEEAEQPRLLWG